MVGARTSLPSLANQSFTMASIGSSGGDDDGGELAPEAKGLLNADATLLNPVSDAWGYFTSSNKMAEKRWGLIPRPGNILV